MQTTASKNAVNQELDQKAAIEKLKRLAVKYDGEIPLAVLKELNRFRIEIFGGNPDRFGVPKVGFFVVDREKDILKMTFSLIARKEDNGREKKIRMFSSGKQK